MNHTTNQNYYHFHLLNKYEVYLMTKIIKKSLILIFLLTRFIASSFSPSAIFFVLLKCSSSVKLGVYNDAVVDSSGEDDQFEFVIELLNGIYVFLGNQSNQICSYNISYFNITLVYCYNLYLCCVMCIQ